MRLEVVLRCPSSLSRRQREQLQELFAYLVSRETFSNAVGQLGIETVSVETQNPALPQATDTIQ